MFPAKGYFPASPFAGNLVINCLKSCKWRFRCCGKIIFEFTGAVITKPGISGFFPGEMKINLYRLPEGPEFLLWTKITHQRNISSNTKTQLCTDRNIDQQDKAKKGFLQAVEIVMK